MSWFSWQEQSWVSRFRFVSHLPLLPDTRAHHVMSTLLISLTTRCPTHGSPLGHIRWVSVGSRSPLWSPGLFCLIPLTWLWAAPNLILMKVLSRPLSLPQSYEDSDFVVAMCHISRKPGFPPPPTFRLSHMDYLHSPASCLAALDLQKERRTRQVPWTKSKHIANTHLHTLPVLKRRELIF